jgi:hypothetical protein
LAALLASSWIAIERQSGLRRQRDLGAGDDQAALLPVIGRQFRRSAGILRVHWRRIDRLPGRVALRKFQAVQKETGLPLTPVWPLLAQKLARMWK